MLRKGRLAITVFETIAKKGDIYKQIAKERTVRVEGDSDRAGLHAQVTSNVADSATVCERHFLIQNDQLNEYSTDPFVEEITVDSAMGLVQKFVSGQVSSLHPGPLLYIDKFFVMPMFNIYPPVILLCTGRAERCLVGI